MCVGKEDSENGGFVVITGEEEEMNLGVFESNSHSFVVVVVAFFTFYSLTIPQNQSLAELAVWVTLSVYQETTKYLSDYDFISLMSQKHPEY